MDSVRVEHPGPGITRLTLNRPERLNALDHGLVQRLHELLADIRTDRTCRAVILTGNGRGFCAGLDLNPDAEPQQGDMRVEPARRMLRQQHIATLITEMRRLPQPIIAAVNGAAAGGGLAIALGSDIRIASDAARFSVAFVRIGLSGCDIGVSYLLPRLVGASRAFELMLTGREIDADEAVRMGLVVQVVPPEDLTNAALECAGRIVGNTPFGVWMTKEVMWSNLETPSLEAAIDLENRTQVLATFTGDMDEAVRRFNAARGRGSTPG